jgi:hypothetical protein
METSTGGRNGIAGAVLTLTAALCAHTFAAAQPHPASPEEIIVRGRSYAELRAQIRLRQEVVFEVFNDINSDDAFDIHCKMEPRLASHILERRCLSNSWREQDANMGQAFLGNLQGLQGSNVAEFRAEQLRMQKRLQEEMRRLAYENAELGEAVLRLGQAMQALQARTGRPPTWTMYREVSAGNDELPFSAERIFEVRIGLTPWTYYLTQPTFTLGEVSGKVRKLEVDCEQGDRRIDYEPEVEWTLPEGWSRCELRVRAARATTFTFYEFQ